MATTSDEAVRPRSRHADPLVVVSPTGEALGEATVWDAHQAPGTLHRAVSVQLVDDDDRWLVQQRAASKALFAGRWANTCCTHPRPGEGLVECARRRLREELSVDAGPLDVVGGFTYRAEDTTSGMVEHEHDVVIVGRVGRLLVLDPDPAEVDELRWVPWSEARWMVGHPTSGAPWAPRVLQLARVHLADGRRRSPEVRP